MVYIENQKEIVSNQVSATNKTELYAFFFHLRETIHVKIEVRIIWISKTYIL